MGSEWVAALGWRFVETDDGGIALRLEPPKPLFAEAFDEAVGTWAFVGGLEILSLHWVDRLIERLESPADSPGVEQIVAESSGAELVRVDDLLLARDAIFDVPDEQVALAEVLPALHAWREVLLHSGASTEAPDPAKD